jgi:hypothetical protein
MTGGGGGIYGGNASVGIVCGASGVIDAAAIDGVLVCPVSPLDRSTVSTISVSSSSLFLPVPKLNSPSFASVVYPGNPSSSS